MDSLYLKYIEQRNGRQAIWRDYGFITYKIIDKECFIADMFVDESERKSGKARELIEDLDAIAYKAGCSVITGNICLRDPGSDQTIKAALKLGFQIASSGMDVLLISKEIKE